MDLKAYLAGSRSADNSADRKIAVIVANGVLMNGESLPGVAGADTLIAQLRTVRQQDDVRAVVIRIDSPGGSVFASEMVRKELELVQLAGKTVVASMAGVAASGGYWIAATSDRIVAQPSTITGSIGIFGIVPTFEASLANLGVAADGVTTSPLAAADPFSGLGEEMAQILQANVENGYERFINTVARGRDMAPEEVHKIAQGRVWIGSQAADLGLVDELGDLAHAIEVAATLANLTEYQVERYEPEQSPQDRLLRQLIDGQSFQSTPKPALLRRLEDLLRILDVFDDPMNAYALCEACSATSFR